VQGKDGRPVLAFASQEEWEGWLAGNHSESDGVWLRFAKKGAGVTSVGYAEALDVALCFGWIDSQTASLDERFYLQRFTPRGRRSKWSQVNREHVARLAAEGRMQPAGLAQVAAAQADGRWDAAYEPPSRATVPDDLQRELDARPRAAEAFAGLSSQNRYAILYRVQDAKRPETRARRIAQFVEMLERGETLHP
jgi:uncharacterized protein YdeI (YjbR/CyaY-like superfamily)